MFFDAVCVMIIRSICLACNEWLKICWDQEGAIAMLELILSFFRAGDQLFSSGEKSGGEGGSRTAVLHV